MVLPGGAEVEGPGLQLPGPDLVVLAATSDADGVQEIRQGRGELLGDPVLLILRRPLQERPDRGQRTGLMARRRLRAVDAVQVMVGEFDLQAGLGQETAA